MAHQEAHTEPTSGQKTLPAYITGLVLSVILTLIAFGLVEKHLLSDTYLYVALAGLAITQFIVQTVCFLRLNSSSTEGRWNLFPYIFTLLIIAILVSGSLWIMYNLNYNMMN